MEKKYLIVIGVLIILTSFAIVSGKSIANNDNLVYDGEIGSAPLLDAACIDSPYIQSAASSGLNSGNGLKIAPDSWHAPYFKIYCNGVDRLDLTKYTDLVFYIRTNSGTSNSYFLWLNTWANPSASGSVNSPKVNIASYVQGNIIDSTWKKVSIPLSALRSPAWSLTNTESIFWDIDSLNKIYYIDNITFIYNQTLPYSCTEVWSCSAWSQCQINQQTRTCTDLSNCGTNNAKPTTSNTCYTGHNDLIKTEFLSPNVIRITSSGRYDFNDVLTISNYHLSSSNDLNFKSPVFPVKIGREYYLKEFPGNYLLGDLNNLINNYHIYLIFNKPMTSGKDYVLTVNNIKDDRKNNFPVAQQSKFNFNDNAITGTVKANQVGYLPESRKFAYIGNYLGDLGPMEISPTICEIVNYSSNAVVLTVPATYRNSDAKLITGEKLYDCDFSSLKSPGNYFVRVPGFGRTYNFKIGNDIYNDVYYKTVRAFYYQRAGIALEAKHVGIWARDAGHVITDAQAKIHQSQTRSPLYNGEAVNSTINLSKGWYDAGDYGKYVTGGTIALFQLLTVYEMSPNKFKDGQLNIPESSNGIPDILDESKWELDWMKNMQAPDGGVYHKVTTTQWASTMPAQDNDIRWISEKSTHSTVQYAAILAKASGIYRPFNSSYANELLLKAEKSWRFSEEHPITYAFSSYGLAVNPPGIGGGSNADKDNAADDKAWAAAELYKATGKEEYNTAFNKYWNLALANENYDIYGHNAQFRAAYTYATIPKYKSYTTNHLFVNNLKNYIKIFADDIVRRTDTSAYRSGMNDDSYNYFGYGTFSQSSRYAWTLVMANNLINDSKYLDYAKINLDQQLGSNPQYKSYITGVGQDYPRDPLSTISALDGIKEPIPGLPVYGVQYWLSEANSYNTAAQSSNNLYPGMARDVTPSYSTFRPVLRRYYDQRNLVEMGEYTVVDLGYTAAVYGYLSTGIYQNISDNLNNSISISVNGKCGTNINLCASGIYKDVPDSLTENIWDCLGIDKGASVTCSLAFNYNKSPSPISNQSNQSQINQSNSEIQNQTQVQTLTQSNSSENYQEGFTNENGIKTTPKSVISEVSTSNENDTKSSYQQQISKGENNKTAIKPERNIYRTYLNYSVILLIVIIAGVIGFLVISHIRNKASQSNI